MATGRSLKQQVLAMLDALPDDALEDVAKFLEYQRYKRGERQSTDSPYRPVPLGGLWEGVRIRDEDVGEVQR
jgi:hypothetical protein